MCCQEFCPVWQSKNCLLTVPSFPPGHLRQQRPGALSLLQPKTPGAAMIPQKPHSFTCCYCCEQLYWKAWKISGSQKLMCLQNWFLALTPSAAQTVGLKHPQPIQWVCFGWKSLEIFSSSCSCRKAQRVREGRARSPRVSRRGEGVRCGAEQRQNASLVLSTWKPSGAQSLPSLQQTW